MANPWDLLLHERPILLRLLSRPCPPLGSNPLDKSRNNHNNTKRTVLAAAASFPEQVRWVPRQPAALEGQGHRGAGAGADGLRRRSRSRANRRRCVRPARRFGGLVGLRAAKPRRAPDTRRGAAGRSQGGEQSFVKRLSCSFYAFMTWPARSSKLPVPDRGGLDTCTAPVGRRCGQGKGKRKGKVTLGLGVYVSGVAHTCTLLLRMYEDWLPVFFL